MAAGFIVGVLATQPPTTSAVARPVYDQSGYLYTDFDEHAYFDPPSMNPALAVLSLGLGIAGSAVVIVGTAIYVGCFIAT